MEEWLGEWLGGGVAGRVVATKTIPVHVSGCRGPIKV